MACPEKHEWYGMTQTQMLPYGASLVAQMVKNLPAMQETQVWSLGQEDPLEKGMATHSSILALENPWTEGPGGLQSLGLQRVGHDWSDFHINTETTNTLCSKMSSASNVGKSACRGKIRGGIPVILRGFVILRVIFQGYKPVDGREYWQCQHVAMLERFTRWWWDRLQKE